LPRPAAHDDDLSFRLEEYAVHYDVRNTTAALADELLYVLGKYQPAIAGFPWQVGDERFEAMKELKELYELEEVAPLTGFDNGMVVYHRSVLPLFFVSFSLPSLLLNDRHGFLLLTASNGPQSLSLHKVRAASPANGHSEPISYR
jgi:hypothetical protein